MSFTIKYSLTDKVKICLTNLGMEEKYKAFHYLAEIIVCMLRANDDEAAYRQAIHTLAQQNAITESSIKNSLLHILKNCNCTISNNLQFNLKTNATLNKIRVIIRYIIDNYNITCKD